MQSFANMSGNINTDPNKYDTSKNKKNKLAITNFINKQSHFEPYKPLKTAFACKLIIACSTC